MKPPVFFDIETGPVDASKLDQFMPEFTAPGNYKDPEKIRANIIEQQNEFREKAALSALTGEVLCIGIWETEFQVLGNEDGEKALLEKFWELVSAWIWESRPLVGHFCKTFDLPFLVRRSLAHGIRVPRVIWDGRFFNSYIVDLAEAWACGCRDPRDRISLDNLGKFLGIGQKCGDGADFAQLWKNDRAKSLQYLQTDINLTRRAYEQFARVILAA